jgi:hypothetical protein
MAVYEVQKLSGGDWRPYSAFDEKVLAIDAAKDLMRGDRVPSAVRVMEEPDDGSAARMVYRQTAVDEHNEEVVKRRREDAHAAEGARKSREAKKQDIIAKQAPKKRAPSRGNAPSFTMLMVRLALLVVAGVGALGVLRYYYFD